MRPRRGRRRPAWLLAMALGATVLPACGASAGGWGRRHHAGAAGAPTPYMAYRPAFREPPVNPLFINSYAGYNYGRGPRAAYAPTGFIAEVPRPTDAHHNGWLPR